MSTKDSPSLVHPARPGLLEAPPRELPKAAAGKGQTGDVSTDGTGRSDDGPADQGEQWRV